MNGFSNGIVVNSVLVLVFFFFLFCGEIIIVI